MPQARRTGSLALHAIALTILAIVPLVFRDPFSLGVVIMVYFWAAAASAWNLSGGYAGQLSLGHAAFFGIGAYTSTLLFKHVGLSPWIGMVAGAVAAVAAYLGNPNTQSLHCDHGYVDYQVPAKPRRINLVMWHSAAATAWLNRWDGGEGFQTIFLRRGYPVYIWDGPHVGRANWGCTEHTYNPTTGQDQRNFTAWRFGVEYPNWFDGVQFPTKDPEAWNQASRARYLEFDTVENARMQSDAAAKLMDTIGPSVALTNSAGGMRAILTALKTNIADLKRGGILIVNEDEFDTSNLEKAGYEISPLEDANLMSKFDVHKVAMTRLTRDAVAGLGLSNKEAARCKNFFALGLVYWLYDRDAKPTEDWITDKFKKNSNIGEANLRALRGGRNLGENTEAFARHFRVPRAKLAPGPVWPMSVLAVA